LLRLRRAHRLESHAKFDDGTKISKEEKGKPKLEGEVSAHQISALCETDDESSVCASAEYKSPVA